MPSLKVRQMLRDDVYTDTARINEEDRIDKDKRKISEGCVCKVSVGEKSKLLSLRGDPESMGTIRLDDISRGECGLGVDEGENYHFEFKKVGCFGQFLWAWRASNPAYRISARVGVLSAMLGVIGLVLGIIGLYISLRN